MRSSMDTEGWRGGNTVPMVLHMENRTDKETDSDDGQPEISKKDKKPGIKAQAAGEVGGPEGPEPTRYGDWERNGRVSDF